jgi:putative phosphoesterase
MHVAIFSDGHANQPALEMVLADIRRQSPDAVYCLGDLVGYAPFPNEVTERIRTEHIATIMGNYDDGVGFDRDECGCAYREAEERRLGDQSFRWTKEHVTPENKAFLRGLPPNIRTEVGAKRVLLVHGSPRKINEYLFEDRPVSSFQRLAASSNADVIVFGHTHKPYARPIAMSTVNAQCYRPRRCQSHVRMSQVLRRTSFILVTCLLAWTCGSPYEPVRRIKHDTVPAGDHAPVLEEPVRQLPSLRFSWEIETHPSVAGLTPRQRGHQNVRPTTVTRVVPLHRQLRAFADG